jgi:uracil phosphoribosyltransferase
VPVIEIRHPIIKDCLTRLRDKRTGPVEFRQHLNRIAKLLTYEAVRDLPLKKIAIETPLKKTEGEVLADPQLVVVPVLRAGIGMMEAVFDLLPFAVVGIIGLYRDEETFAPHEYYHRLPQDLSKKITIILDPMLATGGSLLASIKLVRERGAADIRAITLLAAPEGVKKIEDRYPEVRVYTAAIDERLNENAYIMPGLGDAGDRLLGTV